VNIVLTWDVHAPYEVAAISLSCPRYAEVSRDSIEYHWKNFALDLNKFRSIKPQSDDAEHDDELDGIELRREGAKEDDE
jgi:hypothetical protein